MTSLGWQTYLNVLERASWLRGMILGGDRRTFVRRVARPRSPEEIRFQEASQTYASRPTRSGRWLHSPGSRVLRQGVQEVRISPRGRPREPAICAGIRPRREQSRLVPGHLTWSLGREAVTAVTLARRATAMDPSDGNAQNTLAVAHLGAGNLDAADESFRRSMELRNGGDSFDWYFLARLEAARDHPTEARTWYDKATSWHLAHSPKDAELQRFRQEAALALGLPAPEIEPLADASARTPPSPPPRLPVDPVANGRRNGPVRSH